MSQIDYKYDEKKDTMTITVSQLTKAPYLTRFKKADVAERAGCNIGDPKSYMHATTRGFQTLDVEHRKRPIKVSLNIMSEMSKKDRQAVIENEENDDE